MKLPLVIGLSAQMRGLSERAAIAARSRLPILLTSEPGSDAEEIARAIHVDSCGVEAPFERIGCSSMTSSTFEDALTGAFLRSSKNRGTVFLADIDTLAPPAQQLLEQLMDNLPAAMNGAGGVPHCKIITSSARQLAPMVAEGSFSRTLFQRINIFTIEIPPLRSRPDDIPPLAEAFRVAATQRGLPATTGFSADAMDTLTSHTWPGNTQELRSVVSTAVFSSRGREIGAADIESAMWRADAEKDNPMRANDAVALPAVIQRAITDALRRHEGNVTAAARELDISKVTLYRRLDEYKTMGIDLLADSRQLDPPDDPG